MLAAFLALLVCELIGEFLRNALHLPVPSAVIGMFILAAIVTLRDRGSMATGAPSEAAALDRMAAALLKYMGLLFVPAGVGVVAEADVLRAEWKPIAIALVGSTLLSLLVTGFVMHRLVRASRTATTGEQTVERKKLS
jgi:holin-like protein